MKTPESNLIPRLFELSEFDGISLRSATESALSLWGPPDRSQRMAKDTVFHCWGGVQLWGDPHGLVGLMSLICMPILPPKSGRIWGSYEAIRSLRVSDLPLRAVHRPQYSDDEESYYEIGDVDCVFEIASQAIVKVVISPSLQLRKKR